MIVKVIQVEDKTAFEIHHKENGVLYKSADPKELEFVKAFMLNNTKVYFRACWQNGKVLLKSRIGGYDW